MKAEPARPSLEALLRHGLAAVAADEAVERVLRRDGQELSIAGAPLPARGELVVVAMGKAAVPMAAAACRVAGSRVSRGLVVTKDGHAGEPLPLPVREAAHPVPDQRCAAAGRELIELVSSCGPEDTLLVLLSGGASALTTCPIDGVSLADLAALTRALLEAGADIEVLNCVRKHLSVLGGGGLALACAAARIELLAVSDVLGDALDVIGSGPCAPDRSTWADAAAAIERFGLGERLPSALMSVIQQGVRGELAESAKPGAAGLSRVRSHVVARNADARRAVLEAARESGLDVRDLGEVLRGEAREVGRQMVDLARSLRPARPLLLVAGGETVVTVRGSGRGGRNQELALAAAIELARARPESDDATPSVALIAIGTDGTDGPTDAAGAYADAHSVNRGRDRGVDASEALRNNDSHGFFETEGGSIETGPTGTNVMDLLLVWVDSGAHDGASFD